MFFLFFFFTLNFDILSLNLFVIFRTFYMIITKTTDYKP